MNIPTTFIRNPAATDEMIATTENELGVQFPDAYKNFIKVSDGGEGIINDHYIIMWKVRELGKINREYQVQKYADGLLLFGSSGGGEAFGFDLRNSNYSIVQIPFIGLQWDDAEVLDESFQGLLEHFLRLN